MDEQYPTSPKEQPPFLTGLAKQRDVRQFSGLERILVALSPAERLLLYVLTALLALSTLWILGSLSARASVSVASPGGSLTEGVVGTARFINPLLAISEADRDLTQLVYSGLTRTAPDGTIMPDLASSYEISEDGLTYTFRLREGLTFHDGEPLTTEDVLFTVQSAQNPDIKSPQRANWEGVVISAVDESTIQFTLPNPYAPFIENTAMGVLPAHLWQDVPVEEFSFSLMNTDPVGSGPYRVSKVETNRTGAPVQYELIPFKNFALGAANLRKLTLVFFANERALVDAWSAGRIESFAGVSPAELSQINVAETRILRTTLPRVFGVFYNQDRAPILADISARAALDAAIDKETLVEVVLEGYAVPLEGPIPPGILSSAPAGDFSEGIQSATNEARAILERNDWTFDEVQETWVNEDDEVLTFALATADTPELVSTAEFLVASWRAAGIDVDLHVYPLSELNANIIRPRAYDAILFGEVVGRTLDLFAFWHSSQRNDPGLNLSLYTNVRADDILAEARATTNRVERRELYGRLVEILQEERPAIFLYAPELVYIIPERIHGVELGTLAAPSDRFSNVYKWYTDTERVWSIFTNTNNE